MKILQKECKWCGRRFDALIKEIKRGGGKFCSRVCFGKYNAIHANRKTNQVKCLCSHCNKEFFRNRSALKKSKHKVYFCSRVCKDQGQRISGIKEIQPDHYGTTLKNYRKIAFRNLLNKCIRCGYNNINEILEVHHKNRDRDNNNLNNLQILCPTCHAEEHFKNRDGKWKIGD